MKFSHPCPECGHKIIFPTVFLSLMPTLIRCAGCRSVIKVIHTKGLLFLLHILLALTLAAIYYYFIGVKNEYYNNNTLIYSLIGMLVLYQTAIALVVFNIGEWRLLKDLREAAKKNNDNAEWFNTYAINVSASSATSLAKDVFVCARPYISS